MEILGGLVSLVVLALDIWAIVNVVRSEATTGKAFLWVLLILVLPVVGLIIWLLVGPRSLARG